MNAACSRASGSSLAVLVLAAISGFAFRAEFAADIAVHRPYAKFPVSSLLGVFATALAIRLAVPLARRSNALELKTIAGLSAIGFVAFVLGRFGIVESYSGLYSRFPIARSTVDIVVAESASALAAGLIIATFGWPRWLRSTGLVMRPRLAPFAFASALLAVLPAATWLVELSDEYGDLPNVVCSGVPTALTVVFAAIAARVGADRTSVDVWNDTSHLATDNQFPR